MPQQRPLLSQEPGRTRRGRPDPVTVTQQRCAVMPARSSASPRAARSAASRKRASPVCENASSKVTALPDAPP